MSGTYWRIYQKFLYLHYVALQVDGQTKVEVRPTKECSSSRCSTLWSSTILSSSISHPGVSLPQDARTETYRWVERCRFSWDFFRIFSGFMRLMGFMGFMGFFIYAIINTTNKTIITYKGRRKNGNNIE